MKLQYQSDLHLEFQPHYRVTQTDADVLILAGDICVAEYFTRSQASPKYLIAEQFREFFKDCSEKFKHVIYVLGNHEHYYGNFHKTADLIKSELLPYNNIHILDNETIELDGVLFFGATLWTDLNKNCPITWQTVQRCMNDYHVIQVSKYYYGKLNPQETMSQHNKTIQKIKELDHDKIVIVSHHAPSPLSIYENYKHDHYLNGGYVSDLSYLVADKPEIVQWFHGHTHTSFDYMFFETRVSCNPHGYGTENPEFNPTKFVEV